MKAMYILAAATVLITSQAHALTAYEKNHGCNHEVGDCPDQGGGGGGGGGEPSNYMGSFPYGDGGRTDFFHDSQGEWWVTTFEDGSVGYGFDNYYGPKLKKKAPTKNEKPKRPKFAPGEATKGPLKTFASSQADAAKVAADKKAKADALAAAEKKAAEEAKQKKANENPTLGSSKVSVGVKPPANKRP